MSDSNKMTTESIARVFGPTIVGSASSDPSVAIRDLQKQKAVSQKSFPSRLIVTIWFLFLLFLSLLQVIERFLKISEDYWRQYLSPDDNPDPCSPRKWEQPVSATSTPMISSPSTPELMPGMLFNKLTHLLSIHVLFDNTFAHVSLHFLLVLWQSLRVHSSAPVSLLVILIESMLGLPGPL